MAVLKIKSTHKESQGDFVLIDEENFDSKKHELYVENKPAPEPEPAPEPAQYTKTRNSKDK